MPKDLILCSNLLWVTESNAFLKYIASMHYNTWCLKLLYRERTVTLKETQSYPVAEEDAPVRGG